MHPFVAGSLIAGYIGHGRFDPSRNVLILDAADRLDVPPTRQPIAAIFRVACRNCVQDKLVQTAPSADAARRTPLGVSPRRSRASLDASGAQPCRSASDDLVTPVGVARAKFSAFRRLSNLPSDLMEARLREELKATAVRKAARSDIESDWRFCSNCSTLQARTTGQRAAAASAARQQCGVALPSNDSASRSDPLP